jgi:hypothetical protein
MGYRRITRGRKAHGSKGKGKGKSKSNGKSNSTSKFKTRYRKMSGGFQGEQQNLFIFERSEATTKYECSAVTGIGSGFSTNYTMHSHELDIKKANSRTPIVFDPALESKSSIFGSKKRLRAGYIGNQMAVIGNYDGEFVDGICVIKTVNDAPLSCGSNPGDCTSAFVRDGSLVSGDDIKSVFFGNISKGDAKSNNGLFFDVDDDGKGRLFIGSWHNNQFGIGPRGSLGIEVDFMVPEKQDRKSQNFNFNDLTKYTPIGINFGFYINGKRFGYSIYLDVGTGKITYVCYLIDDECITVDSFATDEQKKIFKANVRTNIASVFTTLLNFKNTYKNLLLGRARSMDGAKIKSFEDRDFYKGMYTGFVEFCFGLLDHVNKAYETERDKEANALKSKAAEEAADAAAEDRLKRLGRQVVNPKIKEEEEEKLNECAQMLIRTKKYVVKTPEDIETEKQEQLEKDRELFQRLKDKEEQYLELEKKLAFFKELEPGTHEPQLERNSSSERSSHNRSSRRRSYSVPARRSRFHPSHNASMLASLSKVYEGNSSQNSPGLSPGHGMLPPRLNALNNFEHVEPARGVSDGGKMTRKNMRMRTRMRTRAGTRRSRRGGSQCGMRQ